jgi:hypothetical protein
MVRVVHASPDAPAVDVYVDGQRAFADAQFAAVTKYAGLPAGMHHIQVFPAGAQPTGKGVIDATVDLKSGRTYSIAAIGDLEQIAPLVLNDKQAAPRHGNALIRFVHVSPNAPAVDVAVANGPTLAKNIAFGKTSRYISAKAGTYTVVVRVHGTKTAVLRVPGVHLKAGSTYSAFVMGLAGGTPALRAVLTQDRQSM